MLLGRTASFDLVLASADLLGVVGEVASPPIKFLPSLWSGWRMPFVVYFYKVYLNTSNICFFWLLSRVWYGLSLGGYALILRVFFSFWCLQSFGGGSEVVSKYSSAQACVCSVSYYILGGLRSCIRVWHPRGSPLYFFHRVFYLLTASLAALLAVSWSQSSPWFSGFPEFSEGLLRNCEKRLWNVSSWLLFFLSWEK